MSNRRGNLISMDTCLAWLCLNKNVLGSTTPYTGGVPDVGRLLSKKH